MTLEWKDVAALLGALLPFLGLMAAAGWRALQVIRQNDLAHLDAKLAALTAKVDLTERTCRRIEGMFSRHLEWHADQGGDRK